MASGVAAIVLHLSHIPSRMMEAINPANLDMQDNHQGDRIGTCVFSH